MLISVKTAITKKWGGRDKSLRFLTARRRKKKNPICWVYVDPHMHFYELIKGNISLGMKWAIPDVKKKKTPLFWCWNFRHLFNVSLQEIPVFFLAFFSNTPYTLIYSRLSQIPNFCHIEIMKF